MQRNCFSSKLSILFRKIIFHPKDFLCKLKKARITLSEEEMSRIPRALEKNKDEMDKIVLID